MKLYFSLIFILIVPELCDAQADSSYIGYYNNKLSLKTYLLRDFVYMNQEIGADQSKTYRPNNPLNIGLGFAYKNYSFSFSYGFDFLSMDKKKHGKTKSLDFQYHYYSRRLVFDLFIQRYKGFYIDSNPANVRDKVYEICPDLKIYQYGLYGQYVFNNKKYSYRAAFDQTEKQLKSAGSILAGGGIYFTDISSDSSFVYKNSNNLSNFQFGVSAGYAYTWVIGKRKRWLISTSATTGINFGSESISKFGKQKLEVYPTVFPRFSTAYNRDEWSLGFSFVGNILFFDVSEANSLNILSGGLQLTFIKRFK